MIVGPFLPRCMLHIIHLLTSHLACVLQADKAQKAAALGALTRLSTGSVVLYEAMCRTPPPQGRGNLLVGIIIDDLGPDAEQRFKVGGWLLA